MSKLGYLILVWAICEGVICEEEHQKGGFVETLDFSPIFQSGPTSLASGPLSSAILKADKSQYPQLFDAIVSSSIDSLQTRVAPRDSFSAERFGFNPIASSGFLSGVKSAKLVSKPKPQPQHHAQPHRAVPIQQRINPLQLYDIRTVHDADYKVYKPEENEQQEILASLRRDPSVASYFKPAGTNIEVTHPLKYHTEQPSENAESLEQNYRPNAYIAGPSRIRRYTDGRRSERLRKSSEEDEEAEEPYYYKPKAFDGGHYSSAYKQEKDPNKEYDYPYDYDSGYDHKEYERIKEISEQQAAEIKQNPENCKEVIKDSMKCVTCKDPKTGGNFESCSYVAEPKNNQYAYSKERKFDSNDEPDASKSSAPGPAKYEEEKDDKDESPQYETLTSAPEEKYHSQYKKSEVDDDDSENDKDDKDKYKAYYVHSSKPGGKPSAALTQASDEESEDKSDAVSKPYNYQKAIPGFYTDNNPKKDVEHVLAEFKKKDRSACKKVQKNGMTCFQCIDSNGLKNEECMYVSESAPQRSHLAYQELKEFTSKPATLAGGSHDEAESQIVTTSSPPLAAPQKSAAYVQTNSYGRKLKRKKAPKAAAVAAADSPVTFTTPLAVPTQQPTRARKAKRSEQSVQEGEERAAIVDETNIAPPEEFAGASSHGAFWAETMPRYSAALGVTLPEFMLARSEHEASFDEAVAGA